MELFNFSFFSISGWVIGLDYCGVEWFALEMNQDHSVVSEMHPSTVFQTLLLTMRRLTGPLAADNLFCLWVQTICTPHSTSTPHIRKCLCRWVGLSSPIRWKLWALDFCNWNVEWAALLEQKWKSSFLCLPTPPPSLWTCVEEAFSCGNLPSIHLWWEISIKVSYPFFNGLSSYWFLRVLYIFWM